MRLETYAEDVLRFASNFDVSWSNNQAERDVRLVKLQQKISGCWRTLEGARTHCAIRSYISTMKKQRYDVLTGCDVPPRWDHPVASSMGPPRGSVTPAVVMLDAVWVSCQARTPGRPRAPMLAPSAPSTPSRPARVASSRRPVEGRLLLSAVGLAFDDELVGSALQAVDRGLGEQGI